MAAGTTLIEPWRKKSHCVCDSGRTRKTTTIRSFSTVGFAAGTPQRCDAESRPRDVGVAEGGLERRDPTLLGGSGQSKFTLGALIQVAGEDDSA